jgi:hypothetical protein
MKISNKITRTEIKKSKEKMIRVYFLWNREKKGKKNKRWRQTIYHLLLHPKPTRRFGQR